MKVNPYQSIQQNPYRKQVEKSDKAAAVSGKRDKLEISSQALEMQQGTRIEKERIDKVEQLKKQIEAGEYKVNPQAVAAKFYGYWNE
ncbi:flagellar biosynthesis anti-sigma factor FlgM [Halalkalibacter urbisdiaboli]|uniref:flagellar biosynthesis anti-sigma factor FlgM n=1 Tax=Halalkalibacter urbisdiaboli TaxID=1960589 RepID=UPI000B44EED6|nr:flagellar biosynthesis anti-sigma factor FlgM [Halalkalibacter urbisdiaboli]